MCPLTGLVAMTTGGWERLCWNCHQNGERENPRMLRENMQTPCRKTPSRQLNLGPSCCEAIVLPTAPPCSLVMDWRPVQGVPRLSPIDCWR
ncbi:hypothetical protein AMECASPLE_032317 [Ameca splendens]|uniref:Uncharacterized protein n=1 Tax=Ameca splendens TaxID=208324 RepID=A0ABV1A2S5_9TELE